jgi:hypothetical protein
MSAPIDEDANTLSVYAPKRCRAEPAAQTSVAAKNALVAVPGGLRGGEIGAQRGLLADLLGREAPIQRQRGLARSLDPEFLPPAPLRPRARWRLGASVLTALSIIAVIYFNAAERFFPRSTASRQQTSDRTVNPASPAGTPALELTKRIETEMPRLQLGGGRGMGAEPTLPGIPAHGRADGAVILSTALAAGTTLSSGFGADAWPVVATEAILTDTWDIPAKDSIGIVGLVANRWPTPVDWAAASQVIANSALAIEAPQLSVASPHVPMPRQPDREETAILIKQGKLFMANRDPAGARVVLERAARYRDAEAALMLAATYDPVVLRELKIYGLVANVAKARTWYEMAKEFGSTEAPRRLEILASATH